MTRQPIRHKRQQPVMRLRSVPDFKSLNLGSLIETESANKTYAQIKRPEATLNTNKTVNQSQPNFLKKRLRHEADFSAFEIIDGQNKPFKSAYRPAKSMRFTN